MYMVYSVLSALLVIAAFFAVICGKVGRDLKGFVLIIGIVVACFTQLAAIAILNYLPRNSEVQGPWALVSIRSTDATTGTFVWSTLNISGELIYTVFIENDDGSFTPYQIPGDKTTRIIEDQSLQGAGSLKRTVSYLDSNWSPFGEGPGKIEGHEILVPVGSVRHNLDVNERMPARP